MWAEEARPGTVFWFGPITLVNMYESPFAPCRPYNVLPPDLYLVALWRCVFVVQLPGGSPKINSGCLGLGQVKPAPETPKAEARRPGLAMQCTPPHLFPPHILPPGVKEGRMNLAFCPHPQLHKSRPNPSKPIQPPQTALRGIVLARRAHTVTFRG